jgi:phenylpyruvate tautomerase PptA (4-oxalocrotonate tautomerase family)
MPVVAIQVGVEYSRQQELAIIRAVSTAMTRVLKIPEGDIDARLFARDPHRLPVPPGKGEQYTLVIIDMFGGCPLGAGKSLYRSIVMNLCLLLIPADHIRVVLHETERDDWGTSRGMAASEVAGYATKVWAPFRLRVRRGAPMGWLRLLAQVFGLRAGAMRDS